MIFSIVILSPHGFFGQSGVLGMPDTGGQVVFVLELAKRFSRLGYNVDVMTRWAKAMLVHGECG